MRFPFSKTRQFRLLSLFIVTLIAAVLTKGVIVLGRDSFFYGVPIALAGIGYLAGRSRNRSATGAVLAGTFLLLYVASLPLVEQLGSALDWPTGTLRLYELYCQPFYHIVTVAWFYPPYYVWATFCDMVPLLAISLLCLMASLSVYCGIVTDRMLRSSRFVSATKKEGEQFVERECSAHSGLNI